MEGKLRRQVFVRLLGQLAVLASGGEREIAPDSAKATMELMKRRILVGLFRIVLGWTYASRHRPSTP